MAKDIADSMLETLFELVGWLFKVAVNVFVWIVKVLFNIMKNIYYSITKKDEDIAEDLD